MKKLILSFVGISLAMVGLCQKPYWQDVNTVAVNRELPRTEFVTYASREAALGAKFDASENYQLLNGVWKFKYYDAYGDVPANITEPSADATSWSDIKVPGNWERQGFGTAIYVNQPYEFQPRNPQPPFLPEANPVGVYRREFTVDKAWDGKDIFLNIAGAKSGVYVYINGKEGFS